ncbi:MAG: formylglycine-generating enzyme family protein [Planctomycetota bacterium]|nr:formylglycine-generating enzyme family protein [Planctomycetota bacterium]
MEVSAGVPSEFGFLLAGPEVTAGVPFSNGLLCLVGTATSRIYRYNVAGTQWNSLGQFDNAGVLQNIAGNSTVGSGFDVPLTVPGSVPVTIMGGDTWNFQLWYRDTPAGNGTSNFSTGLSVTFGPRQVAAGMVPIPPGTFEMGSSAASGAPYYGNANTEPVHSVTISQPFWMGKYEVTQVEFQALMGWNHSSFLGSDRPVEEVTWQGARAYCAALTAREAALGKVPTGYEYRLPTEAEWEYACRAGMPTEFNTGAALYCGDARIDRSNHSQTFCNAGSTVNVGRYAPNGFGLYDMHGNVFEWCLDSYANYYSGAVTDPLVTGGAERVIRGGCFGGPSFTCRSASRIGTPPLTDHSIIGFRVVLAPVLVP